MNALGMSPTAVYRPMWLLAAAVLLSAGISVRAQDTAPVAPAPAAAPMAAQPVDPNRQLEFSPDRYAFVKLAREPKLDEAYARATTMTRRLQAWRNAIKYVDERANSNPTTQRPGGGTSISPRYVITMYGGVVDMRRFLWAAVQVMSAMEKSDAVPLQHRVSDYEMTAIIREVMFTALEDDHATKVPDEVVSNLGKGNYSIEVAGLPSNAPPGKYFTMALGCYYATQIAKAMEPLSKDKKMNLDIEQIFEDLMRTLVPLPNNVVERFSYLEASLGLNEQYTTKEQYDKTNWYSAVPLVQTKRFNAKAAEAGIGKLAEDVDDGRAALAKANLEVVLVKEKYPIMVRAIR